MSSCAIILRSYGYERDVLVTKEKNVVMQQCSVGDAWVCISVSTFARIVLSLGRSSAYFMKRSEVFLIRHSYSLIVWRHITVKSSEVWKKYGLRDIHQILTELIQSGGKTIVLGGRLVGR